MITFETLTLAHLPRLTAWLQAPHVRAFWDDGERDEAAVRAHYFALGRTLCSVVFAVRGRPAGFLQAERVTPEHEFWAHAAPGGATWAMDLLIGEPDLTGQGWGPQVIAAFVSRLRDEQPDLRRVLIDPDQRNVRAQRAYEKAGFAPLGFYEGLQLMALDVI
ncbi:GNAT family N-acetyltransferase [Deinococcus hohokamensis]|uniref:GNAT family N-acetyltransferase n=1 Tax=Deinococcus hohokamensis TaxID=309883 RepID=A0ABV9IAD1_9DEIO